MKKLFFLISFLSLSGCGITSRFDHTVPLAPKEKYCMSKGLDPNSEKYFDCLLAYEANEKGYSYPLSRDASEPSQQYNEEIEKEKKRRTAENIGNIFRAAGGSGRVHCTTEPDFIGGYETECR